MIRIENRRDRRLVVGDGRELYELDQKRKQYTKVAQPELDSIVRHHVWRFPEALELRDTPSIVGQETLKIKSERFDCWVIEVTVLLARGADARVSIEPGPMRLWVAKGSNLLLRSIIRMGISNPLAGDVEGVYTFQVRELEVNGTIPPQSFVFNSPKGARQVSRFESQ